ncbi:MAG: hypothetical protein IT435_11490 [Phycisphaerales bacterium]|nr:hypothetical protein [Phycisphaerales bacterium]
MFSISRRQSARCAALALGLFLATSIRVTGGILESLITRHRESLTALAMPLVDRSPLKAWLEIPRSVGTLALADYTRNTTPAADPAPVSPGQTPEQTCAPVLACDDRSVGHHYTVTHPCSSIPVHEQPARLSPLSVFDRTVILPRIDAVRFAHYAFVQASPEPRTSPLSARARKPLHMVRLSSFHTR